MGSIFRFRARFSGFPQSRYQLEMGLNSSSCCPLFLVHSAEGLAPIRLSNQAVKIWMGIPNRHTSSNKGPMGETWKFGNGYGWEMVTEFFCDLGFRTPCGFRWYKDKPLSDGPQTCYRWSSSHQQFRLVTFCDGKQPLSSITVESQVSEITADHVWSKSYKCSVTTSEITWSKKHPHRRQHLSSSSCSIIDSRPPMHDCFLVCAPKSP